MGYQVNHQDLRDMEERTKHVVHQNGENVILLRQHLDEQIALLREDIDDVLNSTANLVQDLRSELEQRIEDLERSLQEVRDKMPEVW